MSHRYFTLFFLFILLFTSSFSLAQQKDLIKSRHSSYYGYIFKLTDAEAKKILRKGIDCVDRSFLHTLVDSVPPDLDIEDLNLTSGNFLEVEAVRNRLEFNYFFIADYSVHIHNNSQDLCVSILDSMGQPLSDAIIKIKHKTLKFDALTQTYYLRKTGKEGILSVTRAGVSSYYTITDQRETQLIKRIYIETINSSPLRYLYRPAYSLVTLPYYGVRSLIKGRNYNPSWRYFRSLRYRIFDVFSPGRNGYNQYYRSKYQGYMVLNKPMFRPMDTIKMKSFVVMTQNGLPYDEPSLLYLQKRWDYSGDNGIFLGKLNPVKPGAFVFDFVLSDSLKMILDQEYILVLNTEKDFGERISSCTFLYEDYELKRNKIEVIVPYNMQYKGVPFSINVTAKDDNGMPLPDSRIELELLTKEISRYYDNRLFVPYKLWEHTQTLGNGKASISIPDSIFGKLKLTYQLKTRLFSGDNEKTEWDTLITYDYKSEHLKIELLGDSIRFSAQESGLNKEIAAEISGWNEDYAELFTREVTLPHTELIDRLCYEYELAAEGLDSESIDMTEESPLIEFFTQRTSDSVFMQTSNPRNLPFSWFLYQGNKLVDKGYDKELEYRQVSKSIDNFLLSVHYIWAGKAEKKVIGITRNENLLDIRVNQPNKVFPGQKAEIEITVKDSKGMAVPGVDLCCYGITSKFHSEIPTIPVFKSDAKSLKFYNSFKILNEEDDDVEFYSTGSMHLDYKYFRNQFGLDTIEYYHFLYPGEKIYTYTYPAENEITQVAPFIIEKGEILPIKVLYIDERPIYFNWVDNPGPYSFRISPGKHHFRFLLGNKEIKLSEPLECKAGMKTIFSFSEEVEARYVLSKPRTRNFTFEEIQNLSKYVLAYRGFSVPGYNTYLEHGFRIFPLTDASKKRVLVGPVDESFTRFRMPGYMEHGFNHEPGFEYEFLSGLIKMRSVAPLELLKYSTNCKTQIGDQVYSWWRQQSDEQALINKMRREYTYDGDIRNSKGSCLLKIELEQSFLKKFSEPLNMLLINCDSTTGNIFLNGNTKQFKQLQPARYCIMIIMEDESYFFSDTIQVKKGGENFLRILTPDNFKRDKTGEAISTAILQGIRIHSDKNTIGQQNYFRSMLEESRNSPGGGTKCRGVVIDKDTHDPIPFANIFVTGTKNGTCSDMEGRFELNLPLEYSTLTVAYVGYTPCTIPIITSSLMVINLKASSMNLEAVVVTAMGMTREMKSTGYSTVEYVDGIRVRGSSGIPESAISELSGKVAGVNIEMSEYTFPGSIPDIEYPSTPEELSLDNTLKLLPGYNSSMRSNFSDCAYWKPSLTTDDEGKAKFSVTYPDDITKWSTYVLAMDGKSHSGIHVKSVASFKPLLAQLYLPRFLVKGDTATVVGTVANYLPDSIPITTTFELNGIKSGGQTTCCIASLKDTLQLSCGNADTLEVKYTLYKEDGYFDGEIRDLPVKEFGIEETKGVFMVLDKDSTFVFEPVPGQIEYTISADAEILELVKSDLSQLRYYPYLCNEQLASKILGLLAEKKICEFLGEKFSGDKDIRKMITKLEKNQNEDHVWGWWDISRSVPWISTHVIEALIKAREAGFTVNINNQEIINSLVYRLSRTYGYEKIQMIYMLGWLKAQVDYSSLILEAEKENIILPLQWLQLAELRQLHGMKVPVDSVIASRKTTLLGNIYWGSEANSDYFSNGSISSTLCAYRILEKDSLSQKYLPYIKAYLLGKRNYRGWTNTYENANIISTLLPSLLNKNEKFSKPILKFEGAFNSEVSKFPFTISITTESPLMVTKTGSFPVYLTRYTRNFNAHPEPVDSTFRIQSELTQMGSVVNNLTAAKSTILKVKVIVPEIADYVMIEIPIPAGCSYDEKPGWHSGEEYREYYRDKAVIFCNRLYPGTHSFEIKLLPRYNGSFTLLPARAELMYFPTFFGRNEIKRIRIK